ncbi:MAG TPA: M23 family metallopeptidase [Spirochaetota bacterium]|nr:M23 family metallopeptidase [Spirochaetota bacterium]
MITGRPFRLCMLFLIALNLSFQWPVDNGRVTSVFGESRADHFHDGVDMVSPDGKIYPLDEGDLVYLWDRSMFPLDAYSGGGNYRVLKHGGELYSIYLHLQDEPSFMEAYGKRDPLGIMGNTGRSYGTHLHFSVLNRVERVSINPKKMLPALPDRTPPSIGGVFVRVGDRYSAVREGASIRLTRHYPLLIEITDSMGGRERLGAQFLAAYLNGRKVMEIYFTTMEYSKNGLTISGNKFHDLFDEKGYYKIGNVSYNNGSNSLKIVAADFAGNAAAHEMSFNVNLDIKE